MNDAWKKDNSTKSDLGCSANEVTASVVNVEGPTSCKEGEFIYVNVTTSIFFRATRYDFAVYTSLEVGGDPIFGENCARDVLGAENAGAIENGIIADEDGDTCYDVTLNGVGATLDDFAFQDNLMIPCIGNDATGEYQLHSFIRAFTFRYLLTTFYHLLCL